jgi:hypothetical protein
LTVRLSSAVPTSATDWKGLNMSNRESWLADFATAAKPHLTQGLPLGGNEEAVIRLSCGFTPKTGRRAADAAIVPPAASDDFIAEIFVSPIIDSTEAVAKLVLPLLKLAHIGNWRSAAPSVAKPLEILPSWAVDILAGIGAYPHAALEIEPAPKQSTRLIKAVCYGDLMNGDQHDAYIVRISRSTASTYGTPICPICNSQLVIEA